MKLTWFGETALRIHLGGEVVVIDADRAAEGVDRNELQSGADHVLELGGAHAPADSRTWKPRPAQRLLEAGDAIRPVDVWSLGDRALLIDPDEDMPLLVLGGGVPEPGRWMERAVVLLVGPRLAEPAEALVASTAPKLIALAAPEADVEATLDAIRDRLDGTGLVALEPGLAVEV
ncbi:hypothetical protein [Devosia sediminis]|uniref:Uncharacterized protein n=1 Tax=Devosia sediminis TaxID=2798801 RepID=A0A934MGU4_9HYPH|nr:hypothetical protein [Devosia sediminis]MBJ3784322.1 hypothetical protein [Devosia sediminis]